MSEPQYGQYGVPGPGPAPDNNLVWAILTTLFCCLPLGIVSIVKASQVNGLWAAGQYDNAQKASQDARKFAIWAAIVGAVFLVIYIIFVAVVGFNAVSSGQLQY
jgi:predicted secreted protein